MSSPIVRKRNGRIRTNKINSSDYFLMGTMLTLLLLTLWGFAVIDTKGVDMGEAAGQTLKYVGDMFGRPRALATHFGLKADASGLQVLGAAVSVLLDTLALAFLTTLIGAIAALVLGLLAARNLTSARVSNILKGIISLVRAVPTVLWVLIFAIGDGLGAVAAVIGMSFHTVGYLLKAYSESFEELDKGVIEALRAAGAGWLSIVFQAVLPSSVTYLLSWTFIRFEINFAVAVAMGAAAGAGGIGFNLFMAAGYFFDIREIGYITILILIVALLMELLATRLKKKYHIHE
ncbi:MAG: ABC transporter permease subunit [Spirochaetales bacterium]|nr:ABC transporter permease subunit [Spirochaetales bacterium]